MALEVELRKRLPYFELQVSLSCGAGETVAVVGPSGSGKTTLLRLVAGLERPDGGRISYGGETWADTERGVFVPPQGRRLGYVFQEPALFPHLTVHENAAFAADKGGDVEELLRLLGIWHLRGRRPERLSGGERQRCALCQVLARRPRLLLLDEPFSALDVEARRRLRRDLRDLLAKLPVPVLHVTHDPEEALYLADRLLPISRGRVAPEWLETAFRRDDAPQEAPCPAGCPEAALATR